MLPMMTFTGLAIVDEEVHKYWNVIGIKVSKQ
jgi:hypothetical protein